MLGGARVEGAGAGGETFYNGARGRGGRWRRGTNTNITSRQRNGITKAQNPKPNRRNIFYLFTTFSQNDGGVFFFSVSFHTFFLSLISAIYFTSLYVLV
jgi:hypothetical protein